MQFNAVLGIAGEPCYLVPANGPLLQETTMPPALFDAIEIAGVHLFNRLMRSATWEGMCGEDGSPPPRLADLYRQLVAGGVGLIISGYATVRADGGQLSGQMGIHDDLLLPALQGLTRAVHEENGRIFCQLVHAGGLSATNPLAPSGGPSPFFKNAAHELDATGIRALVEAFGAAARRCRQGGFDGLQLHGAHGYLIHQFLSPLTNRRQDEYGGPLAHRMRFLLEVYGEVRRQVGYDFPVTIKLSAADHLPEGMDIEEAVLVARQLDQAGIDAIEVSAGTAASAAAGPVRTGIDTAEQEAYHAEYARRIRQAVRIPVAVVGGLRSATVLEKLLHDGVADQFSLSRPLIRQPDLPKRWRLDPRQRATCISCNGCFRPGLKEGGIYCVVERQVPSGSAPTPAAS
jgi:2,4-dienoyl-CoA reductase-like NADH-dependent reductase (Old Yellow Enzyme family)